MIGIVQFKKFSIKLTANCLFDENKSLTSLTSFSTASNLFNLVAAEYKLVAYLRGTPAARDAIVLKIIQSNNETSKACKKNEKYKASERNVFLDLNGRTLKMLLLES